MLRTGVPADSEEIDNVRIAAWQSAYRKFMPQEYLDSLETSGNVTGLRERLASQDINFSLSVVEVSNSIVAFSVLGKPRYKAPSDTIELWALNVHPQFWRKGFGQQLTKRAITSATTAGFKNIGLWCISGNQSAEATYEQAGFVSTGNERSSSKLTGNPIHERYYIKEL